MDCAVSAVALPEPATSQTAVQDASLGGWPDLDGRRWNEPATNWQTCRNRDDVGAALRVQQLTLESGSRASHRPGSAGCTRRADSGYPKLTGVDASVCIPRSSSQVVGLGSSGDAWQVRLLDRATGSPRRTGIPPNGGNARTPVDRCGVSTAPRFHSRASGVWLGSGQRSSPSRFSPRSAPRIKHGLTRPPCDRNGGRE